MNVFQVAYAKLAAIDPAVPWAVLSLVVFLAVYALRRLFPTAWERFAHLGPLANLDPAPVMAILRKAWQTVPGQLIGVAIAALGAGEDVKLATLGALAGIAAALAHEIMKSTPWLPYRGNATAKTKPPVLPLLSLVLILFGCHPAEYPVCEPGRFEKIAASCAVLIEAECEPKDPDCPIYVHCWQLSLDYESACSK